jgi:hypothetical protein
MCFLSLADVCLTYENHSAMKRESTNWQEGRDIWWQVSFCTSSHKKILMKDIVLLLIICMLYYVSFLYQCVFNMPRN